MSVCSITLCFPWQRSIAVTQALSRVAPGWPQGSDWNHPSRQACSLFLFKAVIPVHRRGCYHAVPVSGVAVCSWMLLLHPRGSVASSAHYSELCPSDTIHLQREGFWLRGWISWDLRVGFSHMAPIDSNGSHAARSPRAPLGVTLSPDVCLLLLASAPRGRAHLCPALSRRNQPPSPPLPPPFWPCVFMDKQQWRLICMVS